MSDVLCLYYSRSGKTKKAIKEMTRYTLSTASAQFEEWKALEELLLVKFIDGNVKAQEADGSFKHSQYHTGTPAGLTQPGYTEAWKRAAAREGLRRD